MVQMIMRDLKRVFALWSVHFRVSTLERFRYKEFLRNSSGIKFFVRVRKVSALEDVRFRDVPLYFIFSSVKCGQTYRVIGIYCAVFIWCSLGKCLVMFFGGKI